MRFSANLGFLWTELPLLDRIAAAREAGFDAIEFHDDPETQDPAALREALATAGLPVLSLNTRRGETSGCAAIPGREAEGQADIARAAAVAAATGAAAIHVLAGQTDAPGARAGFLHSLRFALGRTGGTVLIEPICREAIPGYFLHDLDTALGIVAEIGDPRLRVLFDCFHIATAHGDVAERFRGAAPHVGHVQIASVPGRAEPTTGALDYAALLPELVAAGYRGAFGCEYRPTGSIAATLAELRRRTGTPPPG